MNNQWSFFNRICRFTSGFTLIEILVVMLIIGIMTGVALLAFGDFGASRKIKIAATQFADLMPLIEEKALLQPAIIGININDQGYAFYQLQDKKWQAINNDPLFRFRPWPKGITIQMTTEHNIRLPKDTPQIIVSPAATVTPFILQFRRNDKILYKIEVKLNGAVDLKNL